MPPVTTDFLKHRLIGRRDNDRRHRNAYDGTRGKSAGCSLTSAFARRSDVGRRIMIDNIRRGALANDIRGEQALDIGKAGQVTQKVAPSPGSAVSSVTSAHDVTRQGSRPNPRELF
jgi:hypothetical protein